MLGLDSIKSNACSSEIAKHPVMKRILLTLLGACQSSFAEPSSAPSTGHEPSSDVVLDASSGLSSLMLTPAPGEHESCPANSPWSCSSGSQSSCCYEGSNGIFLQTQFWDYSPATGPESSWTLHGLWSDKCSGGYQQFCNKDWAINSAEDTLEGLGMSDLVETMSEYWKNQGGTDNTLWTHEFNKHGTCMSSVSPNCYGSGQPKDQNVGDFFNRTVGLFQELTTYDWLSSAGITPSEDSTWTVSQFSDALAQHTEGTTVYLGCDRNNAINEVWYFFSLKGSVADGEFKFIDSISTSSCTDGFKYLPKGSSGGGGGGGDNGGSYKRANIKVVSTDDSGNQGCLISDGSWFTSGTCATFRFKETVGGVSVSSSKGPCAIVSGQFKCGKGVTAGDFELKDQKLSYGGVSSWEGKAPQSNQRSPVKPEQNGNIELHADVSF